MLFREFSNRQVKYTIRNIGVSSSKKLEVEAFRVADGCDSDVDPTVSGLTFFLVVFWIRHPLANTQVLISRHFVSHEIFIAFGHPPLGFFMSRAGFAEAFSRVSQS